MSILDFRDLDPIDGPLFEHIDDGHYIARLIELGESEDDNGNARLVLSAAIVGGNFDGCRFGDRLTVSRGVTPNDIGPRKAFGLTLALGLPVQSKRHELPDDWTKKMAGRFFGVQIQNNVSRKDGKEYCNPQWYTPLTDAERATVASLSDRILTSDEAPVQTAKPTKSQAARAPVEPAVVESVKEIEDEVDDFFNKQTAAR